MIRPSSWQQMNVPEPESAWWEDADPATDPDVKEWVVTLYHPDTGTIASQSVYEDYYEALRAGEAEMPWWDVDVLPIQEAPELTREDP